MRIYLQKIGTSLSTCMLRNGKWWSIRHRFPGSIHNSKSGPTLNHEWPFWFPCFTNWKVSYLTGVNLDRSDTEVLVAYSLPKSTHQKCEETTWTMDRTLEFQETSINFSGVWQGVIVVGCAVALLLCLDITSTIPICSAKSLTAAAEVRSASRWKEKNML